MRKSRQYEHKPKRSAAPGIILVLLIGVAIYFFIAGSMGKWIGENVVQPVFSFFEEGEKNEEGPIPTASDAPTDQSETTENSEDAVTKSINTPRITVYALQTGAFSDAENANTSAVLLARKGGAGYVINDGEFNRVLLSCYFGDDEAISVMTRLETEDNIVARQHEIDISPVNIEITAKESTIETIRQGFEYIPVALENIQVAGFSFDSYDFDECEYIIDDTATKLNGIIYELERKTDGTNNQVVLDEIELLKGYKSKIESIDFASNDMVAISSKIKYTQIDMVYDYKKFIDGL